MKASLRPGILRYVLSVEASADDGWLPPYELADVVDNFVANHSDNMPKSGSLGLTGQFSSQPKTIQRSANVPSKSVNAFTASAQQDRTGLVRLKEKHREVHVGDAEVITLENFVIRIKVEPDLKRKLHFTATKCGV